MEYNQLFVESAIFKLLAVWHFGAQMNGPVWQTFHKADYQQSWFSTTEWSLIPITYWGVDYILVCWSFFLFYIFLTGHFSAILNWDFAEVSSRDIHLATLFDCDGLIQMLKAVEYTPSK